MEQLTQNENDAVSLPEIPYRTEKIKKFSKLSQTLYKKYYIWCYNHLLRTSWFLYVLSLLAPLSAIGNMLCQKDQMVIKLSYVIR